MVLNAILNEKYVKPTFLGSTFDRSRSRCQCPRWNRPNSDRLGRRPRKDERSPVSQEHRTLKSLFINIIKEQHRTLKSFFIISIKESNELDTLRNSEII
jgi:hypothetical protein